MVLGHGAVLFSGLISPYEGVILVGITGVAGISTHKSRLCVISRAEPWPAGSKLKPNATPASLWVRLVLGTTAAIRGTDPVPLQQQRDRVSRRKRLLPPWPAVELTAGNADG